MAWVKITLCLSRGESQSGISRPACAGNNTGAGPAQAFRYAAGQVPCHRVVPWILLPLHRLRLTADGKPAFVGFDEAVDVKLRASAGEEELALFLRALDLAVAAPIAAV